MVRSEIDPDTMANRIKYVLNSEAIRSRFLVLIVLVHSTPDFEDVPTAVRKQLTEVMEWPKAEFKDRDEQFWYMSKSEHNQLLQSAIDNPTTANLKSIKAKILRHLYPFIMVTIDHGEYAPVACDHCAKAGYDCVV